MENLKKSKQELKEAIDQNHSIDALSKYMDDYRTQKEDITYFWKAFQKIEKTIKPENINFRKFYEEYIRACIIVLKKEVLENTDKTRQNVERIISIAMNNSTKTSCAFLYAARFYKIDGKLYGNRETLAPQTF